MSPSAAAALTGDVVIAYLFRAWPFAVLHVVVLVLFVRSIRHMRRRTGELSGEESDFETRLLIEDSMNRANELGLIGLAGMLFGLYAAIDDSNPTHVFVRAVETAAPLGIISLLLWTGARRWTARSAAALLDGARRAKERAQLHHSAPIRQPFRFTASVPPEVMSEFAVQLDAMTNRLIEAIASSREYTVAVAATESADVVATNLQLVLSAVERLPNELIRQTSLAIPAAFAKVAKESSRTWQELARQVSVDVQRDFGDLVASSRREIEQASQSLHAAAEEMRRLAEGAQASLTEPIRTAIETAREETSAAIAEVAEFVERRYPAIREDMEALSRELALMLRAFEASEQRGAEGERPSRRHHNERIVAVLEAILELLKPAVRKRRSAVTIWSRLFGQDV